MADQTENAFQKQAVISHGGRVSKLFKQKQGKVSTCLPENFGDYVQSVY